MRFAFAALAVVATVGCSSAPLDGALFVDLRWQVKCDGNNGCIQANHPEHDFFAVSGELANLPEDNPQRFVARCTLSELPSGDLLWNFSAETSTYGLEVRNAQIPAEGGDVLTGRSCTVLLVDGDNTYEGACGSALISEAQPCRITSVGLSNSAVITGLSGRTLSTTIECESIKNQISLSDERNMRAPDDNSPAPLNLVNCDGFPF